MLINFDSYFSSYFLDLWMFIPQMLLIAIHSHPIPQRSAGPSAAAVKSPACRRAQPSARARPRHHTTYRRIMHVYATFMCIYVYIYIYRDSELYYYRLTSDAWNMTWRKKKHTLSCCIWFTEYKLRQTAAIGFATVSMITCNWYLQRNGTRMFLVQVIWNRTNMNQHSCCQRDVASRWK